MARGLAALAVLLCLIAAQAAAGATPTTRLSPANHNPRQFADAAGDSAGAPDVTTTTVSNNSAGVITFRITLPNRTALNANDLVFVGLDTDRNQSTGLEGFDYVL